MARPGNEKRGTWRPLLSAAAADAARNAIAEIAVDLAARGDLDTPGELRPGAAGPHGASPLAEGAAGASLFFAYAHLSLPDRGWDAIGLQLVDDAMETAASDSLGPSLFSGVAGVAWVLRHLEDRLFVADQDPGGEVEKVLLDHLSRSPPERPADLIHGLVGFGVYFLERLPAESARRGLELVIERLSDTAERTGDAVTWFVAPDEMPAHQRRVAPAGHFNLGVAHGVPGVIGLLAEARRRGLDGETRRLAAGAVRWLLAQRLPECAEAVFPNWVGPRVEPTPSRLAWCYGDPGIAAVLLAAARSFDRRDWETAALAVARHAAGRRESGSGIRDAGLCHGAAGVGHLFNRLYQATGDDLLGRAARFWLGKCLEMRQPGTGPGGFQSLEFRDGLWERRDERGFLTGAAGIGLALLAAVTAVEPLWDRVLLTAVPPRG